MFIVDLERWDAGGCVVTWGMGEQGASPEPVQRAPGLCSTSKAHPSGRGFPTPSGLGTWAPCSFEPLEAGNCPPEVCRLVTRV